MIEVLGEMSPGLVLILGALLIPFLPAKLRAVWMLALPVIAFWHLLGFEHDSHGAVQVFDLTLTTLRIDKPCN